MAINLSREIIDNKFLLILLEEDRYQEKLNEIIKSVKETKNKICYVCLSKPYCDVVDELKERGINVDNFFFIDVLTSHYKKPKNIKNCIFLSSPTDLKAISDAIKKAIEENNCSFILMDTVSTLLIYQQTSSIVKFTHHLISEDKHENIKKLFIILKSNDISYEDNNALTKDLEMFADKKLELTKEQE